MPGQAHCEERLGSRLNEKQEEQAQELASTRAHIIHEVILREGDEEMNRSASSLAWSGFAAGLTMGLSFLAPALIGTEIKGVAFEKLVNSGGYPLGFLIVILGRQQLFTENTLTPIVPLLSRFNRPTLFRVLRFWSIVLVTNLIGAGLFGWIFARTHIVDEPIRRALSGLAQSSFQPDFFRTLLKATVSGWLIALLTWVLGGVKSGEVLVIFVITYFVGLGGFTHVVVGASDAAFSIARGECGWSHGLLGFLLPALIGNILGGVGLVALVNHAQVVSGSADSRQLLARK